MIKTLDMQFIRYANLFSKITKIRTNHCFQYNNSIVFAVPRRFVAKAIGPQNKNLQILSEYLGKRVKIVAIPNSVDDIENFVAVITRPIRCKAIEIKDGEAIISVNSQNKASLIGKEKVRLMEMQSILEQYFGVKRVRIK